MASAVATSLTIDTQGLDNVHDSAGSGDSSPNHSPSNKVLRKVGSYPSLHTVEEHAADTQADHIAVLGKLNASAALPRVDLGRASVSFNTNSSQLNLKSLFRVSKYPGGSSPANISPTQAVDPIVQQLGRACYSLEVDVVERMLQAGVDFSSAVDADGNLAIHYAAIAVEARDHDNIFSSSSNSKKPSSSSSCGWLCCGKTVADEKQRQWQSQSKVAQVISLLADAGADINARNASSRTPLMQAILAGNTPAAVHLAQQPSADHSATDSRGRSHLIVAALALSHHDLAPELISALLAPCALLDHKDGSGRTALMYASAKGHTAMVRGLLQAGADAGVQDSTLRSALSYASQSPEEVPGEVVRELLAAGGPDLHPWSLNKAFGVLNNRSQLHLAVACSNTEAVQQLLDAGAKVGAKDGYGNTPLMYWPLCKDAAAAEQMVAALCEAGAPVNERNADGYCPLDLACSLGAGGAVHVVAPAVHATLKKYRAKLSQKFRSRQALVARSPSLLARVSHKSRSRVVLGQAQMCAEWRL